MQAIVESNTRKSNVELPGIPVFDICKDYEIEVPPMKFEPGHWLSLNNVQTAQGPQERIKVVLKFVNHKNPNVYFRWKNEKLQELWAPIIYW